jgi:nucleotide-binding universal stress UspA family protein
MSANVLIPMDGSELTGKAVQDGIALARRVRAKVTAPTIVLSHVPRSACRGCELGVVTVIGAGSHRRSTGAAGLVNLTRH